MKLYAAVWGATRRLPLRKFPQRRRYLQEIQGRARSVPHKTGWVGRVAWRPPSKPTIAVGEWVGSGQGQHRSEARTSGQHAYLESNTSERGFARADRLADQTAQDLIEGEGRKLRNGNDDVRQGGRREVPSSKRSRSPGARTGRTWRSNSVNVAEWSR